MKDERHNGCAFSSKRMFHALTSDLGGFLYHTPPRGSNQRLRFSTDELGQLINNRAVLFPQTLVKMAFFLVCGGA